LKKLKNSQLNSFEPFSHQPAIFASRFSEPALFSSCRGLLIFAIDYISRSFASHYLAESFSIFILAIDIDALA